MTVFSHILISVIFVSLLSFIGVFFLVLKKEILNRFLETFVSFACGSLLGGAFFHLLPESIEQLGKSAFIWVIVSFFLFFILEKFLYWRHCHKEHCEVHAFTYLNLIGDGLHNFIDGAIIAASFLVDFSLGVSTTLAIIFHEIPQEIGDFCILVYGGWERKKALMFNFISALTAIIGALVVYFFSDQISGSIPILLSFAAGGFIYIAGVDIIPKLYKTQEKSKLIIQFFSLIIGIILMWLLKAFLN